MNKWPVVTSNDDGIRPAGKPDECFYCKMKIGVPHGQECVIVTKRVKLLYKFEIEVEVPFFWTKEDILFQRNDSSWCSSNGLTELNKLYPEENTNNLGCPCSVFKAEYLGVVRDTPERGLK